MAKLCLNVCELARLTIPTRATDALMALLTTGHLEVQILHPQTQRLQQAQPAAVQ